MFTFGGPSNRGSNQSRSETNSKSALSSITDSKLANSFDKIKGMAWFGLGYWFNGISTPHELFNSKILYL